MTHVPKIEMLEYVISLKKDLSMIKDKKEKDKMIRKYHSRIPNNFVLKEVAYLDDYFV